MSPSALAGTMDMDQRGSRDRPESISRSLQPAHAVAIPKRSPEQPAEETAMSSDRPITTVPMTDLQRRMYDDALWGRTEVYTKRPDLLQEYEETGGVVAVCHRRIVAHGVDLDDDFEKQLQEQGCDLSEVALIEIASVYFP